MRGDVRMQSPFHFKEKEINLLPGSQWKKHIYIQNAMKLELKEQTSTRLHAPKHAQEHIRTEQQE